jgi:predicted Zn-dependent protease
MVMAERGSNEVLLGRELPDNLTMPLDMTLARVEDDLARGDLSKARQRLRSLVDAFPQRLDLRVRLADVYRAMGQPVQAGRWRYLSPPRDKTDEAEIDAFARAHDGRAGVMAGEIGYRGRIDQVANAYARASLQELRDQALRQDGVWTEYDEHGKPHIRMSAKHRLIGGLIGLAFGLFLTGLLGAAIWGLYVWGRFLVHIWTD